jgi:hypothetical protein
MAVEGCAKFIKYAMFLFNFLIFVSILQILMFLVLKQSQYLYLMQLRIIAL